MFHTKIIENIIIIACRSSGLVIPGHLLLSDKINRANVTKT